MSLAATPDPAFVGGPIRYTVTIVDTGNTGFSTIELSDLYSENCVTITGGQSWPPSQLNPPNLAIWNNIGSLAPGGTTQFWIEFRADRICAAPTNANVVTVTGYLQSASTTGEASLGVQIKNNDGVEEDLSSEPEARTNLLQDVVITNNGATATWRHNGQSGQMSSNEVKNPSTVIYLPVMIIRR